MSWKLEKPTYRINVSKWTLEMRLSRKEKDSVLRQTKGSDCCDAGDLCFRIFIYKTRKEGGT